MATIFTINYGENLTETFIMTSDQFQLRNDGYYLALEDDKVITNAKVILTKNMNYQTSYWKILQSTTTDKICLYNVKSKNFITTLDNNLVTSSQIIENNNTVEVWPTDLWIPKANLGHETKITLTNLSDGKGIYDNSSYVTTEGAQELYFNFVLNNMIVDFPGNCNIKDLTLKNVNCVYYDIAGGKYCFQKTTDYVYLGVNQSVSTTVVRKGAKISDIRSIKYYFSAESENLNSSIKLTLKNDTDLSKWYIWRDNFNRILIQNIKSNTMISIPNSELGKASQLSSMNIDCLFCVSDQEASSPNVYSFKNTDGYLQPETKAENSNVMLTTSNTIAFYDKSGNNVKFSALTYPEISTRILILQKPITNTINPGFNYEINTSDEVLKQKIQLINDNIVEIIVKNTEIDDKTKLTQKYFEKIKNLKPNVNFKYDKNNDISLVLEIMKTKKYTNTISGIKDKKHDSILESFFILYNSLVNKTTDKASENTIKNAKTSEFIFNDKDFVNTDNTLESLGWNRYFSYTDQNNINTYYLTHSINYILNNLNTFIIHVLDNTFYNTNHNLVNDFASIFVHNGNLCSFAITTNILNHINKKCKTNLKFSDLLPFFHYTNDSEYGGIAYWDNNEGYWNDKQQDIEWSVIECNDNKTSHWNNDKTLIRESFFDIFKEKRDSFLKENPNNILRKLFGIQTTSSNNDNQTTSSNNDNQTSSLYNDIQSNLNNLKNDKTLISEPSYDNVFRIYSNYFEKKYNSDQNKLNRNPENSINYLRSVSTSIDNTYIEKAGKMYQYLTNGVTLNCGLSYKQGSMKIGTRPEGFNIDIPKEYDYWDVIIFMNEKPELLRANGSGPIWQIECIIGICNDETGKLWNGAYSSRKIPTSIVMYLYKEDDPNQTYGPIQFEKYDIKLNKDFGGYDDQKWNAVGGCNHRRRGNDDTWCYIKIPSMLRKKIITVGNKSFEENGENFWGNVNMKVGSLQDAGLLYTGQRLDDWHIYDAKANWKGQDDDRANWCDNNWITDNTNGDYLVYFNDERNKEAGSIWRNRKYYGTPLKIQKAFKSERDLRSGHYYGGNVYSKEVLKCTDIKTCNDISQKMYISDRIEKPPENVNNRCFVVPYDGLKIKLFDDRIDCLLKYWLSKNQYGLASKLREEVIELFYEKPELLLPYRIYRNYIGCRLDEYFNIENFLGPPMLYVNPGLHVSKYSNYFATDLTQNYKTMVLDNIDKSTIVSKFITNLTEQTAILDKMYYNFINIASTTTMPLISADENSNKFYVCFNINMNYSDLMLYIESNPSKEMKTTNFTPKFLSELDVNNIGSNFAFIYTNDDGKSSESPLSKYSNLFVHCGTYETPYVYNTVDEFAFNNKNINLYFYHGGNTSDTISNSDSNVWMISKLDHKKQNSYIALNATPNVSNKYNQFFLKINNHIKLNTMKITSQSDYEFETAK